MSAKTARTPVTTQALLKRVDALVDKLEDVRDDARPLKNQRLQIKFDNAIDKMAEVSDYLKYDV